MWVGFQHQPMTSNQKKSRPPFCPPKQTLAIDQGGPVRVSYSNPPIWRACLTYSNFHIVFDLTSINPSVSWQSWNGTSFQHIAGHLDAEPNDIDFPRLPDTNIQAADPLLMEEIRPPGQPVEVGSSSHYLQGSYTSQVVVWDFSHQQYRWLYFTNKIPGSSRYVKFLPFGRSFFLVKRHNFCTLGRSRYNLDPQKMSNFSPKRSGLWWLRGPNFRPLEDSGYIYIYI